MTRHDTAWEAAEAAAAALALRPANGPRRVARRGFCGNNPDGRSAISGRVPGDVRLGFPGIGGVIRDGIAEYVRIPQQPTALQAGSDARVAEFEEDRSSALEF